MKIAILGGTGSIGEGFVLRWAENHEIVIGSRNTEKAEEAAKKYILEMKEKGYDTSKLKISGMTNTEAASTCEIVVLTLPYDCVPQVIESASDSLKDKIVITPVVPMNKVDEHFEYKPPEQGSAALAIREMIPNSARLVAAYHNIPACKLKDVEHEFKYDTVICSDDEEAKKTIFGLTHQMGCLRPLDGGPLSASNMAESITPLLLNLAKMNGMEDLGVNFS